MGVCHSGPREPVYIGQAGRTLAGLGIEMCWKEHLRRPGYFEPTPMYDEAIVSGFAPGGAWPHFDEDGKWCNCVSYQ